jgi:hypothetical protein
MADETIRKELLKLVTILVEHEYSEEQERSAILREIMSLVPAAPVAELIYYGDDDDTPTMLVEKMLAAQPIILSDHSRSLPPVPSITMEVGNDR